MIFFILGLSLFGGGLAFVLPKNGMRNGVLVCVALVHLLCMASFWIIPLPDVRGSFLALDQLGLLVLSVVSTLFFVVSIYAVGYFRGEANKSNRMLIGCLLCFLFSMTLVTVSQHLGLFWVAIEATTLASAPLINLQRARQGFEATWKYLMICSVGIALALLGTFFLAISAIGFKTLLLRDLLSHAVSFSVPWLKLSVIFSLVGYGTKMGLAPMHTWLPDAHSEAPSPISALLSGALLNCAFLGILRIGQVCNAAGQGSFFGSMLTLLGLISMGVAAVFISGQSDYKRMLAYSSVEHMGILAVGIGVGGMGLYGSFFHMVNHAFTKGMLFMTAGNLYQYYHTKRSRDVTGVLRTYPWTGGLLTVGFLAITGMPPFGTFLSEIQILSAAVDQRHYGVAFFYLLFLALIFVSMATIVLRMVQGMPRQACAPKKNRESILAVVPPLFLALIVLMLGLYVPPFLDGAFKEASQLLGS